MGLMLIFFTVKQSEIISGVIEGDSRVFRYWQFWDVDHRYYYCRPYWMLVNVFSVQGIYSDQKRNRNKEPGNIQQRAGFIKELFYDLWDSRHHWPDLKFG